MEPTLSCPTTESDTLCSRDIEKRHEDKMSLKFHQRDGQISSSGQLASRNSFFPQLLVSMKGSPFVCQTHAFILYCYFLYTVLYGSHTHTHPFNSYMNKLYSCNCLFCSCHLSVRLSAHTYPGRTHTHTHTYCTH